jgi:hypothetical protein
MWADFSIAYNGSIEWNGMIGGKDRDAKGVRFYEDSETVLQLCVELRDTDYFPTTGSVSDKYVKCFTVD